MQFDFARFPIFLFVFDKVYRLELNLNSVLWSG